MFGIVTGQPIQWAIFVTLITAVITAAGLYFKHRPDAMRADNEAKVIDATGMDKLLADYGKQVEKFREEVHALRNELQAVRGELQASDRVSQQRNERISTMELIIELLISELERNSPDGANNPVIRQAKLMLRRISAIGDDPNKSHEMNLALNVQADAEQTVLSANRNIRDLEANEARADEEGSK